MNGLARSEKKGDAENEDLTIFRNGSANRKKKSITNGETIETEAKAGSSGIASRRVKNSTVLKSTTELSSPKADLRRYSMPVSDDNFTKSMNLDSETSDSEDSTDLNAQKFTRMKMDDFYDSKQFENLDVSSEVKELFQNITRYTPQRIELNYKLIPFIPDYIPAVGDIDAFLKIPRPDNVPDRLGLVVLDEPASEQSEPAVLQLQLDSKSRRAGDVSKAPAVVKRLKDARGQSRMIDKWIEDMSQLHRSKHPPAVQLRNRFPDVEMLSQPWKPEIEAKLALGPQPPGLLSVDCDLSKLIDLICALLDIPVYEDRRIESLHTLFALFTEVHNVDIQRIHL